MMKGKPLARPLASALAVVLGAGSFAVSGSVLAQDDSAEGDEVLEEIITTGTRLPQTNLVSATAVNVLDSEMIDISGATNMSELIRTLPATGVSALTSTNSNFLVNSSGINTVELRNLGEDRTLVLVNGRRFVAGVPGSQIVDFNSIPAAFIERIDVVTGGASAVYGSDALAGVVNIITRTDLEGLEMSAQGGISDDDDDENYQFSLAAGLPFADDRGHAMFSYTYDREKGVYARNRADRNMDVDAANLAFFTGDPNDWQQEVVPFFSSFSELGRFNIPNGGSWVFDGTNTIPFVSADHGFNRQAYRALSVPLERNLIATNLTFALTDSVELYMEGTYSSVESESSLEPFPLSSEDIYGDSLQQCDPVTLTCSFGIPGSNPFIPADMLQLMRDANPGIADENLVVGFARRMTELDQRGASNLRQTWRMVTGIKGEFANEWTYDVHANWGRTTQAQQSTGQLNVLNMRYSLDASIDPVTGEAVCNDPIAVLQGCIPVNLFGQGAITAGLDENTQRNLLTYLKSPGATQASVESLIFSAFISGDLFDMPAGPARFVFGLEHRDEQSSSVQDSLAQAGLNAGNAIPPTVGRFDVDEAFIELELPLLADLPLAQSLDVTLAARISDYSTVGETNAYAISTKYVPHDDWLIRAQYARAVRAPNVSELFSPLSETFEGVDDPCEGLTIDPATGSPAFFNVRRDPADPNNVFNSGIDGATVGSTIATTCLQDPLVANRVAATGGLVLTQPEIQGVGGFNGGAIAGGSELSEETADSYTLGFVWSPSFVEGLSLSIDWYDIEIEDGIGALGRQTAADQCYSQSSYNSGSEFCSGIIRYGSGPSVGAIRFSNALTKNLSNIQTSGIDLQASYGFDLPGTIGAMDLTLTYSNLLSYDTVPFRGADSIADDGTIGLSEHEAVIGIIYSRPNLMLAWTTQWIGDATLERPEQFFGPISVGDQFFHDFQGRYQFGENLTFVLGVDNVTDEYLTIGAFGPGTSTGWNTAPDIYDGLGRRYYAGLKYEF